jgi:pimeloyl-ACP methyl ester carboxylesterase
MAQSLASTRPSRSRALTGLLGGAAVMAACALFVQRQTRRAEAHNPPRGRFVEVDDIKLHVIERGDPDAPPLVLLHGNGALADELVLSGLVGRAAVRYRVLVFDRPGHGHSDRPDDREWTPEEQARLLLDALALLGVDKPIVMGHAWGTLVALSMALQAPQSVRALVLVSGYYHPGPRLDVAWRAAPALPVLGPLLSRTLLPVLGRLLWPAHARRLFWPREVTEPFRSDYPVWMSLRPRQLEASARESALMIPWAMKLRSRYGEVQVPAMIVAGDRDSLAITRWHARWLHQALPHSGLQVVPNAGHMVHHVATHQVLKAIDEAARRSGEVPGARRVRSVTGDTASVTNWMRADANA